MMHLMLGFALILQCILYTHAYSSRHLASRCIRSKFPSARPGLPSKPLQLQRLNDIVKDDNIFRIHFFSASFFGGALLLVPNLLPGSNVLTEAIYQSWSLFILAVAAIAFKAPSFPGEVKQWLRVVFGTMLGGEFLLSTKSIFSSATAGFLTPYTFTVDAVSAFVFLALSLGYLAAENANKK